MSSLKVVAVVAVLVVPFGFGSGVLQERAWSDEVKAAEKADSADEELLTKEKVSTDGPALLEYFRSRTLDDAALAKLKKWISELGDDSFDVRETASKQLIAMGLLARAALREATRDPDLEVRRRAERCLENIEKDSANRMQVSAAAVRVLKARRTAGALAVLFAYLPSAEDESIAEEVRLALTDLAVHDGKVDPVLIAGLKDKTAVKRAAAVLALCRVRPVKLIEDQLPGVRKLLTDPEPTVRLSVALALSALREKEAVPVLIGLLDALPPKELGRVEELLCRLAAEKTPNFPADGSATAVRKYKEAWEEWWKEQGPKLDPVVLEETARTLGYTTVVLLDGNKVVDLDASNRPRWEINGLQKPLDVQRLPGEKVLVAEYGANRVTERTSKGEVVWEHKVKEPLAAQRLANGNTFIASREGLMEVDRTGREVFNYTRPAGEFIMRARKLPNGDIALVTQLGVARYVRIDSSGRELKSFGVEVHTSGGRIDVLPNGNVLVPELNNNRIIERGADGKVVREVPAEQPIAVSYLLNGHLLLTSMTQNRAVELDRAGKEVWEYKRDSRVTRAVRP
jgi:HEAT repeat protein